MIPLEKGKEFEMGPCYIIHESKLVIVTSIAWVYLFHGPTKCYKTDMGYFPVDDYELAE